MNKTDELRTARIDNWSHRLNWRAASVSAVVADHVTASRRRIEKFSMVKTNVFWW